MLATAIDATRRHAARRHDAAAHVRRLRRAGDRDGGCSTSGADVNARSAVGASGFGGYTALFCTVVSQPNFWMNYGKRGPFVAPFTSSCSSAAQIRTCARPSGSNCIRGMGTRRGMNIADVTALSWGRRFHDQIFVSEPAMRLIEEAGGVE